MRDVEIRPMRDEDVVDADRVCAEVIYSSFDGELESPYVSADGELDLAAWAHDAFALALPSQLTCREDCAGLCAQCGANLNEEPDHAHDAAPDPRWAKLSELRFD